ncbi:MAG: transaldolase family protein, partial [Anaerolineales bacterium]
TCTTTICPKTSIDYLSIYVGRVTDAGGDGVRLLEQIKFYADYHEKQTKIVAASIRNLEHLEEVALVGADAVATPFPLLLETMHSPVTDQSVDGFKRDWADVDLGGKS